MRKILNYLWRAWFILLLIPTTFFCGIFVIWFSRKLESYPKAYYFIRIWGLCLLYGMGFSPKNIGKSNKKLEKGTSYIIISNHTSIMDVMMMLYLHPHHPFFFVGKKELEKVPGFGYIYKRVCVTVDRNDPISRASVYTRCAERMKTGQSIVIFPEGGVDDNLDVLVSDWKDGAFKMAENHKLPIALYAFYNLKWMFPFQHDSGYPGKIRYELLDILLPSGEYNYNKSHSKEILLQALKQNTKL